jgi:hypothetical protein
MLHAMFLLLHFFSLLSDDLVQLLMFKGNILHLLQHHFTRNSFSQLSSGSVENFTSSSVSNHKICFFFVLTSFLMPPWVYLTTSPENPWRDISSSSSWIPKGKRRKKNYGKKFSPNHKKDLFSSYNFFGAKAKRRWLFELRVSEREKELWMLLSYN